MPSPIVSIVIVNFNAGSLLDQCLRSLEAQTFDDFEVLVIDNASRDGSMGAIEGRDRVRPIINATNLGFAAGQNQGIQEGRGNYFMALNFDVELEPNYVEDLVVALDANPLVGTVTGKLLRMLPNGKRTGELDNAGLLLSKRRMPMHRGGAQVDDGRFDEPAYVFGAMAAAAMYRREMLDDIALNGQYFDEALFTWYEDVDLDWRARLNGWECLYVPSAVAHHIRDPQANLRTSFAFQTTIRNRWQTILANECISCFVRLLPWLIAEEAALLVHVVRSRMLSAYIRAIRDFFLTLPRVLGKRRSVRNGITRKCLPEYPQQPLGLSLWNQPTTSSA